MQKLEWWLCQVVKNIWWYIQSFWFHTTKWQTGIQTNKSISICRHAIKLLWLLKVLLSQFCNISFHSTPAKIRGNIDNDCWLHCTLNCTVYCNRPCLCVYLFVGPPYYRQCLHRLWALFHWLKCSSVTEMHITAHGPWPPSPKWPMLCWVGR